MILSIFFKSMKMSDYSVWTFERNVGFTDMLLLGFLREKMFKQRTTVVYVIIHPSFFVRG